MPDLTQFELSDGLPKAGYELRPGDTLAAHFVTLTDPTGEDFPATTEQLRTALAPNALKGTVDPNAAPIVAGTEGQQYWQAKPQNALTVWQHVGGTWVVLHEIGPTNTTPGGPANVAPTISLGPSVSSLILGGTFTLNATAADSDGSVTRVDFFEGATLLASKTTPPYLLDVTPATAGTKSYTATAYDNQGLSRSTPPQSVSVLAVTNQLPTVSGSLSASTIQVGQTVTFSAVATDADGTITQVQFFDGSTLLATVTSAPYSTAYAPTQTGNRSLFVKATDNSGAVRTTAAIPLTVTAATGNAAPTVSLVASPSAPVVGQTLSLSATPADTDGTVVKVEYFNGPTKLGETTQSPHSFSLPITSAGTNFFTAKATDNQGATGLSAVVFVLASAAPTQNVTPDPPTFLAFSDTNDGGSVTLVPASGLSLSDYRVSLPGSTSFAAVSSEVITVGNVAGTVRAFSIAATGRNQSPTGSSPSFTTYAPPSNQNPTVSLTLGLTGTLASGGTQTATATPTDPDGTIASVSLTDNGTPIATRTVAPFTFSWQPTGAGAHTVTVTATDNQGGTGSSTSGFTLAAAAPTFNTLLTGPSQDEPTGTQITSGGADEFRFDALPLGDSTGKVMALALPDGTQVASIDFLAPYVTGSPKQFSFKLAGQSQIYYGIFTDTTSASPLTLSTSPVL